MNGILNLNRSCLVYIPMTTVLMGFASMWIPIRICLTATLLIPAWIVFLLVMRLIHNGDLKELFPSHAQPEGWNSASVCGFMYSTAAIYILFWLVLIVIVSVMFVEKVSPIGKPEWFMMTLFTLHGICLGLLTAFAFGMRKTALLIWQGRYSSFVRIFAWMAIFCVFLIPFGIIMGIMALFLQGRIKGTDPNAG